MINDFPIKLRNDCNCVIEENSMYLRKKIN